MINKTYIKQVSRLQERTVSKAKIFSQGLVGIKLGKKIKNCPISLKLENYLKFFENRVAK